jgi:hypothetical protein
MTRMAQSLRLEAEGLFGILDLLQLGFRTLAIESHNFGLYTHIIVPCLLSYNLGLRSTLSKLSSHLFGVRPLSIGSALLKKEICTYHNQVLGRYSALHQFGPALFLKEYALSCIVVIESSLSQLYCALSQNYSLQSRNLGSSQTFFKCTFY